MYIFMTKVNLNFGLIFDHNYLDTFLHKIKLTFLESVYNFKIGVPIISRIQKTEELFPNRTVVLQQSVKLYCK